MWNYGEGSRRASLIKGEGGDRACVLCLGDFVTKEEDEVVKNEEGPRDLTSSTRKKSGTGRVW